MDRIEEAVSHYLAAVEIDPGNMNLRPPSRYDSLRIIIGLLAEYDDAQNNVKMAQERLKSKEKEASIEKLGGEFDPAELFKGFGGQSEDIRRAALRQLISEAQSRRRNAPKGQFKPLPS